MATGPRVTVVVELSGEKVEGLLVRTHRQTTWIFRRASERIVGYDVELADGTVRYFPANHVSFPRRAA